MRAALLVACLLLPACTSTQSYPPTAPSTGRRPPPAEAQFNLADLAKSDIDAVAEVHFRESIASAKLLTEKLYRRNPRELRKSDLPTPEAESPARSIRARVAIRRALEPAWHRRAPIAFRADFTGDRVFAFGVGIGSMIAQAYNDKSKFYLTDSLDAQRLYNAARNLEIAAWKLANAGAERRAPAPQQRDGPGAANLSFEREFGKLIAYQDTLALVMAQRTNRTIRRFSQALATAVFLPL